MAKSNVLTRSKKTKVQALMQEGRLPEAKELCTNIVCIDKLDADAWVMQAVISRRLGLHKESEACARQALSIRPDMATAQTALGAALQCQGNMQEALSRYRQAVTIDPNLTEAHYLLGNALRELGLLDEAVASYRQACALQPDFLAAVSNLGATLTTQGQTEEALKHLNHALKLAPNSPQVLCNVGVLLERDGRFEEARNKFHQALALNANFVDALVSLASLAEKMGHLDTAKSFITKGLALAPDNMSLIITSARVARTEGRHRDAIDLLERLMGLRPDPTLAGELYLTLGKLYDQVGDVDRAFQSFTEGNRLVAEVLVPDNYDRRAYQHKLDRITAYFTNTLASAWGHPEEDDLKDNSPVFLMGFARSGTTLLDQILDSHPRMQTLSELPTVDAMHEAFLALAKDRPDALTTLSGDEIAKLRKVYFDTAARFVRLDSKQMLIDKMPLNTIMAHIIWRVFPHAKFILAIRHPCDVCLSCFMQNFTLNAAMMSFQTMRDTVELYARVMDMWRNYVRVLPINYHRIRYEDLVADFEGEARRLIGFLGFEWDDAVLNYAEHAKGRVIKTPSYHQVTQPIYQHAKYRWKRYARHFELYMPVLTPFIEYFGYAEPQG
ncbi:tetratricopeptide repeat protein [Sulfuricaulis sp.]|jgi:tetratricopeptide (TPR) repeat protein|uniref:tetratricopeptide repeat protein n=1 Tax=Sulfuricaulis sp. TaxID=2003553 RepID=UPI00355A2113